MRDPREYLVPDWRRDPKFKPWTSPVIPWEQCSEQRRAALRVAWKAGDLRYKLNFDQQQVWDEFHAWLESEGRGHYFIFDIARRYGKTLLELAIAMSGAIRGKVSDRNAYWTDSQVMAVTIVDPLVNDLLTDCPPDLRPRWMRTNKVWLWPDGRKLEVCGLDDPDAARGRHLDRGNIDEAGFVKRLGYVIDSVIDDQMQGRPDAYVIVSSTPPESCDHAFSSRLVPMHRAEGSYIHRTIFDNPMLSTEEIETRIARRGGIDSITVQREMLASHVTDPIKAAFPEYERVRDTVLYDELEHPKDRLCFVSMDPGWVDGTGILFGYWDYWNQRLVIEAEFYERAARDDLIASVVKENEQDLWSDVGYWDKLKRERVVGKPKQRWTDIDHRLIADLSARHSIGFSPTQKDNLAQQLVRVREYLDDGKILISKSCKRLDSHIRSATFKNDSRRELKRSPDGGHYDLAMALVYMVRNVRPFEGVNPTKPTKQQYQFTHPGSREIASKHGDKKKITHRPSSRLRVKARLGRAKRFG